MPETDNTDSTGGGSSNWLGTGLALGSIGVGIGSAISNRNEQRRQNQWNRDHADHSYYRERNDALADRDHLEFYNSPAQQIQRMKAAGLNPALMYGQGSTGQTEMPRGSKPTNSSQPASHIDASTMQRGFEQFLTMLQTQQQTDNLRAQAELAAKQAANVQSTTELNTFELGQKQVLSPKVIESAALGVENQKADIALKKQALEINLDANERNELKNSTDVQKTLEDIQAVRQKRIFDLQQQANIDHKAKAEIAQIELRMNQLDVQIELLEITKKYAETDQQMKLLLQELEAQIKLGGGSIGGVLSKIIGRLELVTQPGVLKGLKERYPLLIK